MIIDADEFVDLFTYWIGTIHFQIIGCHAVHNKKLD